MIRLSAAANCRPEYMCLLFSGFSQAPIHTHKTWLKWMNTFSLNTLVLRALSLDKNRKSRKVFFIECERDQRRRRSLNVTSEQQKKCIITKFIILSTEIWLCGKGCATAQFVNKEIPVKSKGPTSQTRAGHIKIKK